MGRESQVMRVLASICLLLLLTASSWAEDQILVKATNDKDAVKDKLLLRLDSSGDLSRLVHKASKKKVKIFTPEDLKSGAVLRKESGRDLILLKIRNFDPKRGASVTLSYLYSGIPPSEYREITMALRKKDGRWSLYDGKSKKPVKALRFLTNYAGVFGYVQPVGIKEIQIVR